MVKWLSLLAIFSLVLCLPALAQKQIKVVTTTNIIADSARNIAGNRMVIESLMGEGVDPHLYKASPGDIRRLSSADLILFNGLHLEGKMADILHNLGSRKKTVEVTRDIPREQLRAPAEFQGFFDPHVWFDVRLWSIACRTIREALIETDPAGKEVFEANFAKYFGELEKLDTWTRERIQTIPPSTRILVTAHDAFGYFGKTYGLTVRGIQGLSTDSEASLRDINLLVDLLVDKKVPAVFVESSVPAKMIEALAEGARGRGQQVRVGGELFSDSLGKYGSPEGTYIGMVKHNVDTIVKGLTGVPASGSPHL